MISQGELIGKTVLNRYRIVEPLGQGGMGVVYLGRTEGAAGFTRPVVVKRMQHDMTTDDGTGLFIREARILSDLQHPAIVGILDFGEYESDYVMVLEYVHGYHLGQWNRFRARQKNLLPPDLALQIIIRVLEALHYAHTYTRADGARRNIVHRDVSPANILLDLQGQVKLADFGIARVLGDSSDYKTREGIFKGKLPYTSPELYEGRAPSPSSDIYATGVVLFELLTGANPFRAKELSETIHRVMFVEPPRVSTLRAGLPRELDGLLAQATAKKAGDRFSDASELAGELRRLQKLPEGQIATKLAKAVRDDFTGELPVRLRVEPLKRREEAWRRALGAHESAGRINLLSSNPPAPTLVQPVSSETVSYPQKWQPPNTPSPPKRRNNLMVAGGIGVAAIAATVAVVLTSPAQNAHEPRFLVVEKPGTDVDPQPESVLNASPQGSGPPGPSPTTSPTTPSTAEAQTNANSEEQTTVRTSSPPSGQPQAPDPAQLSRRFASRQGSVQRCFEGHAKQIEGRPQVTIRFSVGESGAVTSAQLIPSSLASTALGQCLLGVARSTDFGQLSKPVVFSIPITAKRAQ